MRYLPTYILCIVLAAAVHLDPTGTHLIPVLVGMAIIHGSILLVAAGELSNAKWLKPVKPTLLSFAPWFFLFPLLVKLAPYAWLQHPNRWLDPEFFYLRNVAMLTLIGVIAMVYSRLSLAGKPNARKWAVVYILTFAAVESMVAMDWTMSLDYPWFSTMYTALYMVEAFYAGLVLLGVICFILESRNDSSAGSTVYDGSSLTFGFALFWGGLTFAQYLTIWYGNLPEEVHYFTLRFASTAGVALFTATIVLLFLIPFTALLSHELRKRKGVFLTLALLALTGLFLSRGFQVFPHLHLNFGLLAVQTVAMLGAIGFGLRNGLRE
jgi:hypothetical protein